MRAPSLVVCGALGATLFLLGGAAHPAAQGGRQDSARARATTDVPRGEAADQTPTHVRAQEHAFRRLESDMQAMRRFRPAYGFWRHVFTTLDGAVLFGSGVDGRPIVTVPLRGNWQRGAVWAERAWARVLDGQPLPDDLSKRRDELARRLEPAVGPIVHNPTRGSFFLPNIARYGPFLTEWGAIYERFAVPADIGLAQAIVESGLNGTIRSEARAVGFCQWLPRNWVRLQRHTPHVIEGYNQTTQAPYCAAYLSILATKYRSFIPALSEHHTGGANVGRALVNGERLGGSGIREQYFLGATFARDLRTSAPGTFKDLYGTYGPRSFRYAEMVFGNVSTVAQVRESTRQTPIFAVRVARTLTIADIMRGTGLSEQEVRRFNPALRTRVPAGANLYLPEPAGTWGRDVAFWRRPASPAFSSVLSEFIALDVPLDEWDRPSFDAVLREFRRRFIATATEEGLVMAATLAYVLEERTVGRQSAIVAEFRTSDRIRRLFEQGRMLSRDTNTLD